MPLRSYDIDFRGKIRSLDGNNETDNWYPKETNSTCNRIRLRKCTGLYTRQVMLDIYACGSSRRNATRGKEIINELISYRFLPISFIFVFSSSIEGRVFFLLLRLSWNWSRSVLVAYEFFFRSILFFFFNQRLKLTSRQLHPSRVSQFVRPFTFEIYIYIYIL